MTQICEQLADFKLASTSQTVHSVTKIFEEVSWFKSFDTSQTFNSVTQIYKQQPDSKIWALFNPLNR